MYIFKGRSRSVKITSKQGKNHILVAHNFNIASMLCVVNIKTKYTIYPFRTTYQKFVFFFTNSNSFATLIEGWGEGHSFYILFIISADESFLADFQKTIIFCFMNPH